MGRTAAQNEDPLICPGTLRIVAGTLVRGPTGSRHQALDLLVRTANLARPATSALLRRKTCKGSIGCCAMKGQCRLNLNETTKHPQAPLRGLPIFNLKSELGYPLPGKTSPVPKLFMRRRSHHNDAQFFVRIGLQPPLAPEDSHQDTKRVGKNSVTGHRCNDGQSADRWCPADS